MQLVRLAVEQQRQTARAAKLDLMLVGPSPALGPISARCYENNDLSSCAEW